VCGRYRLSRPDLIAAAMEAMPYAGELSPRYNIAPSQDVMVVRVDKNGGRVLGLVRWGLIPYFTKGKPKLQPINARAETVSTSGMFREAFERRRCLIPADGFYEWRKVDAKTKIPTFIHRKDDAPFAFAGLWERWKADDDAEPVETCTIITTAPNTLMAPIHDREPLVLEPADYGRWLDREIQGEGVKDLLRPWAPDGWEAYEVSKDVNSPRNEGAGLSERVGSHLLNEN
jgi:putative SOS response-associated peptidase YedK